VFGRRFGHIGFAAILASLKEDFDSTSRVTRQAMIHQINTTCIDMLKPAVAQMQALGWSHLKTPCGHPCNAKLPCGRSSRP
jgi:hypothetical protein